MDWTTYVTESAKTVIYPQTSPEDSIRYITAGLCGEVGEVFNDFKKLLRGKCEFTARDVMLNEGGDVYWYLAAFYREYGLTVRDIPIPPCPETVIDDIPLSLVVDVTLTAWIGCAAIAETVLDQQYRRPLLFSHRRSLTMQCDQVMIIFDAICAMVGVSPGEVKQFNIDKLTKRQTAGTLHNHNETDPEK